MRLYEVGVKIVCDSKCQSSLEATSSVKSEVEA